MKVSIMSSKFSDRDGYSVCCYCSVTQSYLTLCDPRTAAHQASLSFTISRRLLRLMSVESVMPSNHLILCHSLQPFPASGIFSSELAFGIRRPKYQSFSFGISPSNEYSGFLSFGIDWFDLLQSKGLSRVFSSTTLQKHQFFGFQHSLLMLLTLEEKKSNQIKRNNTNLSYLPALLQDLQEFLTFTSLKKKKRFLKKYKINWQEERSEKGNLQIFSIYLRICNKLL